MKMPFVLAVLALYAFAGLFGAVAAKNGKNSEKDPYVAVSVEVESQDTVNPDSSLFSTSGKYLQYASIYEAGGFGSKGYLGHPEWSVYNAD